MEKGCRNITCRLPRRIPARSNQDSHHAGERNRLDQVIPIWDRSYPAMFEHWIDEVDFIDHRASPHRRPSRTRGTRGLPRRNPPIRCANRGGWNSGHFRSFINSSTICILLPIHRITGTAIEFPIALYRGPSGAAFPRWGTSVHPSGKPCSLSHSRGVRRRTCIARVIAGTLPPPVPHWASTVGDKSPRIRPPSRRVA